MVELVRPGIEDELEGRDAAPFGEPITTDEVVASLERTFPKDWVSAQADAALDEVTAYLVGVKDSMTIRIALDERADTALDEVKTLLRKADDFEIVFEGVINPVLDENVPEVIYLPLDVTITREEIKRAFLDQVPLDWLREQAVAVVDEAGPYFIGRRNDFQVVVPMDERKDNAERVVGALARLKADEVVRALPECADDATTLQVIEQIRIGSLPQCIPPGLDQRALDILLDSVFQYIDLDELLRGFGYEIPDRIVYTHHEMRDALYEAGGQEALDALGGLRKAFREGWTYTDADLKAGLISEGDESDVQTLEDVRELLRDGWTFTHTDLRQSLRDSGGEEAVSGLDRTQGYAEPLLAGAPATIPDLDRAAGGHWVLGRQDVVEQARLGLGCAKHIRAGGDPRLHRRAGGCSAPGFRSDARGSAEGWKPRANGRLDGGEGLLHGQHGGRFSPGRQVKDIQRNAAGSRPGLSAGGADYPQADPALRARLLLVACAPVARPPRAGPPPLEGTPVLQGNAPGGQVVGAVGEAAHPVHDLLRKRWAVPEAGHLRLQAPSADAGRSRGCAASGGPTSAACSACRRC